ncbi:translation initiation factor IF-2-like [Triticum aestivum]|uniref:translation initiation factor IF-2-like n=1 Tax=Triticum aestivum TaxID=4565 RepID=UPI001D02619B|nr:translation initiation factor IF-2-like [Triticum aestivum]
MASPSPLPFPHPTKPTSPPDTLPPPREPSHTLSPQIHGAAQRQHGPACTRGRPGADGSGVGVPPHVAASYNRRLGGPPPRTKASNVYRVPDPTRGPRAGDGLPHSAPDLRLPSAGHGLRPRVFAATGEGWSVEGPDQDGWTAPRAAPHHGQRRRRQGRGAGLPPDHRQVLRRILVRTHCPYTCTCAAEEHPMGYFQA